MSIGVNVMRGGSTTIRSRWEYWQDQSPRGCSGGSSLLSSGEATSSRSSTQSDVIKSGRDPKGWRDPTPYDSSVSLPAGALMGARFQSYRDRLGNCSGQNPGRRSSQDLWISGQNSFFSAPSPEPLSAVPVIRAMAKAKSQFNAGMTTTGLPKTAKMLLSTAKTAANALRNGKLKLDVSGNYLRLEFGWKQLISDMVHSAIDLEKKYQKGNILTLRGSDSRHVPNYSVQSVNPLPFWNSNFMHVVHDEAIVTTQIIDRCILRYEVEDPFKFGLTQFGLTNLPHLAWDLLPYSFVVDWFARIGSLLNVLDVGHGLNYLGGTLSTQQTLGLHNSSVIQGRHHPTDPLGGGYYGGASFGGTAVRRYYKRELVKDPLSSVAKYIRIWRGTEHLDSWHAQTSVALLLQKVRGLK